MKKTEELYCPLFWFWDSSYDIFRDLENHLDLSLKAGLNSNFTKAQAFFAASHLSHEFTSEQMRLKWVEQEFASVPCRKQWKVFFFGGE